MCQAPAVQRPRLLWHSRWHKRQRKPVIAHSEQGPPWLGSEVLGRIGALRRQADAPVLSTINGITVLTVDTLPGLVQVVGYLKYRSDGTTYLRGQGRLHKMMLPSLFRQGTRLDALGKPLDEFIARSAPWTRTHKDHRVKDCTERLSQAAKSERRLFSGGVPRYAAEPLLQHYGLNTRWLDLVDNLWVALWFACHSFDGVRGYRHAVRRTLHDQLEQHVYIISVSLPGSRSSIAPGLWKVNGRGRVIDLREAVPSYDLRPHAQHGLLVRPHDDDYKNLEFAAIRIPLAEALDWLGTSLLLSPFSLFPPPSVDVGYRRMLQAASAVPAATTLGQIDIYGAGY